MLQKTTRTFHWGHSLNVSLARVELFSNKIKIIHKALQWETFYVKILDIT